MRILFLNNFYYIRGGSEKVLFEEMGVLREREHQVAVFARANRDNALSDYEKYFPKEIETNHINISFKALGTIQEIIYSKSARVGLSKLIKEFRPDVAHAHNIYGRLSISVIDELKKNNIPTLLTLHDFKALCPSYLMLNHGRPCEKCKGRKFYHAVLTKCHKNSYLASCIYAFETWVNRFFNKYGIVKFFISPSKFLIQKHIEYGWDQEKFIYIPNFIKLSKPTNTNLHGNYLLYLGRLSQEKGVKTLLKALPQNFKTTLFVVGDGPARKELEEIVIYRNIRAQFTGYLSGKSLETKISSAKAIVVPSECYENAPLSILEAFAYGKPVIGARIGGIPEMIEDGVNGFLFEPGSVEDLKNKIELLLSLPDERIAEMGRAAREKVEREFNPELHYERLMEVYQKAISRNKR